MLVFFPLLSLICSLGFCSSIVLFNSSQFHVIPDQTNMLLEFTVDTSLEDIDYQSDINVAVSLAQNNSFFDIITFPSDSVFGEQYKCYNRVIQLGIFNLTNCSLNCLQCDELCIRQCFLSNSTCCCRNCSSNLYSVTLMNNTSLSDIKGQDFNFVVDNSNFLGKSLGEQLRMHIKYTITTHYNNKYQVITYAILGVIGLLLLLETVFCLVVRFQSRKSSEALRVEKQEQMKLGDN